MQQQQAKKVSAFQEMRVKLETQLRFVQSHERAGDVERLSEVLKTLQVQLEETKVLSTGVQKDLGQVEGRWCSCVCVFVS